MNKDVVHQSKKLALTIGFWGPLVPQDTNSWCGLLQLFQNVLNFALTISVPIATIVIVYGGFVIMTGGGEPDKLKTGRDAIIAALVGVIIVFGAWLIINTVLNIVGANVSVAPWSALSCS
ncbi:MAG: pilin [Patescibacteria group bacterium]|nr:pilin [Patescibacteria group bacterium]MCL5224096.1 pilin [Patescibacteria group bacterium]